MKNIKACLISGIFLFLMIGCSVPEIREYVKEQQSAHIFPDYSGATLPFNLAPFNFEVKEPGDRFLVQISGKKGTPLRLASTNGKTLIPETQWQKLLDANKNDSITIEIFAKKSDGWHRFKPFRNLVSADAIDPYLYYRDIAPTNSLWNRMAMHQRNLQNFDEKEVFNNYRIEHDCMNCHTFNRNNPDQMLFHIRGKHGGTVFYNKGKLSKINLKTPETLSAGAYCSWHPAGKLVAFAVNKIVQNYYLSGFDHKVKEVFDLASDIVLYNIETNKVFTFPQISSSKRENLPCWSADGKYLYYTLADEYKTDMPNEENLYSLMRVSFDESTNNMGQPEEIISAEKIGKSIAFPTVSPDGRFMLFSMVDFGYFPVNNKSADLYLIDLKTMQMTKPAVNSSESESYFSWSGNSRWFVFSSRRLDGVASKPFICHIDSTGQVSKPFIVPQKDPAFYAVDNRNFSRPELLKQSFNLNFRDIKGIVFKDATDVSYDGATMSSSSLSINKN